VSDGAPTTSELPVASRAAAPEMPPSEYVVPGAAVKETVEPVGAERLLDWRASPEAIWSVAPAATLVSPVCVLADPRARVPPVTATVAPPEKSPFMTSVPEPLLVNGAERVPPAGESVRLPVAWATLISADPESAQTLRLVDCEPAPVYASVPPTMLSRLFAPPVMPMLLDPESAMSDTESVPPEMIVPSV